jgi:hypothetical protein
MPRFEAPRWDFALFEEENHILQILERLWVWYYIETFSM